MQLVHKLQMMHHYRLHLLIAFGLLTALLNPVEPIRPHQGYTKLRTIFVPGLLWFTIGSKRETDA